MDGSYDKGTCRVCGRYGLLSVYGDICSKCHDEEVADIWIGVDNLSDGVLEDVRKSREWLLEEK